MSIMYLGTCPYVVVEEKRENKEGQAKRFAP